MPDLASLLAAFGAAVVGLPYALLTVLGIASLLDRKLSERATIRAVAFTTGLGTVSTLALLAAMLIGDTRHVAIELGHWVHLENPPPEPGYHFAVKFIFDRLSVPFLVLTYLLVGTTGAFASRYLHRESGYNRFFVLYALFLAGMVTAALAATVETLFLGWELVGLSSALLVGFFHDRPAPVRNALRVWTVYRVSDATLLIAAVTLHHLGGGGDFDRIMGYSEGAGVAPIDRASWPFGNCGIDGGHALIVGLLMLFAAAGKSALVPFSVWLPRAMEGPTPSSAVFYGALSVHLGAYLLLRLDPLLEASPTLSALVLILGLITALYAAVAARVQTDIKSALSFASLTQVGLIVAEIGLGWRYVPLVHLLGHACLRTLQFLRAPSVIRDHRAIEDALGDRLPRRTGPGGTRWNEWLYRFALERGYLDGLLNRYVAEPFWKLFVWLDSWNRRAVNRMNDPRPAELADRPHRELAERTP